MFKVDFFQTDTGNHTYLSPKPKLPGQVVMTNLFGEFNREISVGPIVGDTFIHDLTDNVQHIILLSDTR